MGCPTGTPRRPPNGGNSATQLERSVLGLGNNAADNNESPRSLQDARGSVVSLSRWSAPPGAALGATRPRVNEIS